MRNYLHKTINKTEVMYYLEEVISMETADEIESNVYYDFKYIGSCKLSEYNYVVHKIEKLYDEKF